MGFPKYLLLILLLITSTFAVQDSTAVEKSPKKAVRYSLIPGGGQFYNGKWVKGIVIIAMEGYVINEFQKYRNLYNDNQDNHRYLVKRNKYAWWIGLIYIYNLLDALVDSHLSAFDTDKLLIEEGIETESVLPEEKIEEIE